MKENEALAIQLYLFFHLSSEGALTCHYLLHNKRLYLLRGRPFNSWGGKRAAKCNRKLMENKGEKKYPTHQAPVV